MADGERLMQPTRDVPTSGSTIVRVRYCECDPMGVAHHASYVPWLEMARTELLRGVGVTYAHMERSGAFLVVTKLELRYRRPIRYDDQVEIRARVVGGSRIKIRHEYEIVLIERLGVEPDRTDPAVPLDGVCTIGSSELACVGADGRPRELPDWLIWSA
ncbi:MAG: acyl-CoA thioesterase [Phycisphaeraceae bacterium]|nr:acyl-CoA thioesterase [Phycisphaeraceae bacterium]MCW5763844.1 acyl-CoA thioesterase [Phycisphaeraceae bacterium]